MKPRFPLTIILLVIVFALNIAAVQADPWSALGGSGYAVTTEPFPLEEVLPGESVTAKAGTTDTNVAYVVFRWLAPDGTVISRDPEDVQPVGSEWDSTYGWIFVARSTYVPEIVGDWGVQVEFWGPGGKLKGTANLEGIIKIRATSFFAIPEVPLGTVAIVLSMLGSLGVFALKRKKPYS